MYQQSGATSGNLWFVYGSELLAVIVLQDAHQYIALPCIADPTALAFHPLANKSTLFVTGNRSRIESQDAQINTVQTEGLKSEGQNQPGYLGPISLSPQIWVE